MDVLKLVFIILLSTGGCWNEAAGNWDGVCDFWGGTDESAGAGTGGGTEGGFACWPVLPGGQKLRPPKEGVISCKRTILFL